MKNKNKAILAFVVLFGLNSSLHYAYEEGWEPLDPISEEPEPERNVPRDPVVDRNPVNHPNRNEPTRKPSWWNRIVARVTGRKPGSGTQAPKSQPSDPVLTGDDAALKAALKKEEEQRRLGENRTNDGGNPSKPKIELLTLKQAKDLRKILLADASKMNFKPRAKEIAALRDAIKKAFEDGKPVSLTEFKSLQDDIVELKDKITNQKYEIATEHIKERLKNLTDAIKKDEYLKDADKDDLQQEVTTVETLVKVVTDKTLNATQKYDLLKSDENLNGTPRKELMSMVNADTPAKKLEFLNELYDQEQSFLGKLFKPKLISVVERNYRKKRWAAEDRD